MVISILTREEKYQYAADLRQHVQVRGLSQVQLARDMGVADSDVWKCLRGIGSPGTYSLLYRLLGLPLPVRLRAYVATKDSLEVHHGQVPLPY